MTNTTLSWPRPSPRRCSASAPRLASFSTCTTAPEGLGSGLAHVEPLPRGQDRGGQHDVVGDGSRQSHADAAHLGAGRAERGEQLLEQLPGAGEADLVRQAGVDPHAGLAEDLPGHVPQDDGQVPVPEVDSDRESRAPRQPDGGPTSTRPRHGGDDVVGSEVPHDAGDRAGGQPGLPDQVGLGHHRRAVLEQGGQHPPLVGQPQRGRRARRLGVRHARMGWHVRTDCATRALSSRVTTKSDRLPLI